MSVSQPFVPVSYKKNECTRYAEKLSIYYKLRTVVGRPNLAFPCTFGYVK